MSAIALQIIFHFQMKNILGMVERSFRNYDLQLENLI